MTPSSVNRSTDAAGDPIGTFESDDGKQIQRAALVDETGVEQIGVPGNPLTVEIEGGSDGLTDAQLRATAVPVSVVTLPLPSSASTAALQTTGNTALTAIQGATALGAYGINDVEDASDTVTYVGGETAEGGSHWLVRKIDTASGTNISYATVANNLAVLTYAAAWAARATLTYGTFAQAF